MRLRECGELRRGVINKNKKILARTLGHVRPRDSAAVTARTGHQLGGLVEHDGERDVSAESIGEAEPRVSPYF